MNINYYLRSKLIRTPFERAMVRAEFVADWVKYRRAPELRRLLDESAWIERAMVRLIGEDSNCVDVGCHFGRVLSLLLRLAPRGKHLAFEPVPAKAALLRKKFPEVEVHQAALGETSRPTPFFENVTRPGYSGLRAAEAASDVSRELTVPCRRLDQFRKADHPIGFIKLDVEGAEFLVLRGAAELIGHDRPSILFESAPGGVEGFGQTRRDLFDFLAGELDYSIYMADDLVSGRGPLDWERFDAAHRYPFQALNYLAIPR